MRRLLCSAALGAVFLASAPASALTFNFTDVGGTAQGSAARRSFDVAARYWSSVLTNNATVNINIGYFSFGPDGDGILGSAGSSRVVDLISNYQGAVDATKSGSAVDALVAQNTPSLTFNGGIKVVTPGYVDATKKLGIDTNTRVLDTDGSVNNRAIYMTRANAKAVGYGAVLDPAGVDAQIQFNADYAFDFDPTDGIDSDKSDFTLVALHEIGHALGFVSGVDDYDFFGGPSGPCFVAGTPDCGGIYGQTYDANNDYWGSALDLFRYGSNPEGLGDGGPQLDWSIRNPNTDPNYTPTANPYFSLDGGATKVLGDDTYFSRGQFNGASYQASHWRIVNANNGAGNPPQPFLGIMDPVGRTGNYVSALDIAAFDAIGWNSTIDALNNPAYARSTAQIFAAFVPEPATWGQMVVGFGLLGFAARRRRPATVAA